MTPKRKITDLVLSEVINTTTVEEAIEINKTLNPEWTRQEIENHFEHYEKYGKEVCYRKDEWCSVCWYKAKGYTILPASDFLPTEFYKTVEPKYPITLKGHENFHNPIEPEVGQVWCCTNNVMPPYEGNLNYFIHKFTVGKTYTLLEDSPKEYAFIQPNPFEIIDDNNERVAFGKGLDFHNHFRFVSEPADYKPKTGDWLEAVDPCIMRGGGEASLTVGKPYMVTDAGKEITVIDDQDQPHFFDCRDSTDPSYWRKFFKPAEPADKLKMQSQNSDDIVPMTDDEISLDAAHHHIDETNKQLIELYLASDPKHREMMRGMFDADWPKEKVYSRTHASYAQRSPLCEPIYIVINNDWMPEVKINDYGQTEIRFVKNV